MTTPPVIGIDVAKDWLDIAVQPGGEHWRVAHEAAGSDRVGSTHDVETTGRLPKASDQPV